MGPKDGEDVAAIADELIPNCVETTIKEPETTKRSVGRTPR